MATLVETFAVLGVLFSLSLTYRFLLFLWLYLLRPSAIQSYHHGQRPYALVTGATDGIGKALAAELFAEGFNLILHGRNEEKMQKVVAQISSASGKPEPERDIRFFIADAAKGGLDFAAIVAPFTELHITLVVHNVGGTILTRERIDGVDEDALLGVVRMNAFFPLLLTRALLPTLRHAAARGRVAVQFVGSQAADACPPRIALYAASKRFLQGLARALDLDERTGGAASGVRFEYTSVGQVLSGSHTVDARFDVPTSEAFARALVRRIGCGWRVYAPYWVHAAEQWAMEVLGEGVVERYAVREMEHIFGHNEKDA